MHIVIYGINDAPELTGIGKYSAEMAEWLAGQGHDVRVITAHPYYPAWKIAVNYNGWCYRKDILNGVDVRRCPVWVPENATGIKRIIHLVSFALSSLPVLLTQTEIIET